MAFPVIQATNTSNQTSTTNTHTISLPSGIQSGDLLVVYFVMTGTQVLTMPGGWNTIFTETSNYGGTTSIRHACIKRVANGSEGSTIQITHDSVARRSSHCSYRISGHENGELEHVVSGSASGNPDSGNLTPSWGADDYLWITEFGRSVSTTVSAYPSNYTLGQVSINDGTGSTIGSAARQLNASSENPGAFTTASTTNSIGNSTVAIRPKQGQDFSITDTLSLSETSTNLRARNFSNTDTISLTEVITALKGIAFTVSDTLHLTEAFTSTRTRLFSLIDSLSLSETFSLLKKWNNKQKTSSSWTNNSKSSSDWDNKTKSSSTWTNKNKS